MKLLSLALGVAALSSEIAALQVPYGHVALEKRNTHSKRWTKRERLTPDSLLHMRIGLSQDNLENAHDHLMDVSHPHSPNYGKHWTKEQVYEMFQPTDNTLQSVRKWLNEAGIPDYRIGRSENKAWLSFHATADEAERLLHTEYHEFEDSATGGTTVACDQYHVPYHIEDHIDYITPGVNLDHLKLSDGKIQRISNTPRHKLTRRAEQKSKRGNSPKKVSLRQHALPAPASNTSDLSLCDVEITPACIAALYGIPEPNPNPHPNNSMGIYEAELEFWAQPDLDMFFANFTPWIPNGTHPIDVLVDGGVAQTFNVSDDGGEAELDFMMSYPIVYPQTITTFNEDDLRIQTWANDTYYFGFNDLLDAFDGSYCTYSAFGETGNSPIDPVYPDPGPLGYNGTTQCGGDTPTNVISFSYGGQEADVPVAYQKRQCNEFLKLGLQGVTFAFASGDSGVSNYPEPYGTDGPTGCLGPDLDVYNPTWPGTCPYVLSVGATKVYPGKTVFEPESAVYDPAGFPYAVNYSSGGGFSNIYPVPDYQKSAVDTYFADHSPPYPYYSALANETGDIHDILTLPNITQLLNGTKGIYNRIGRGIPDVSANGDNGAVYVGGEFGLSGGTSQATPIFASVLNRINEDRLNANKSVIGFVNPALYANPSMLNDITNGSNPGCNTIGFSAVPGWDPVSGLGTPNYPKMKDYFLSLP